MKTKTQTTSSKANTIVENEKIVSDNTKTNDVEASAQAQAQAQAQSQVNELDVVATATPANAVSVSVSDTKQQQQQQTQTQIQQQPQKQNLDDNKLTFARFSALPEKVQERFSDIMAQQLKFEFLQRQAKLIMATNDRLTFANAFTLASYADENKLSWIQVSNRFCVINGKICEGANSVRARMKQAGINYKIVWGKSKTSNEDTCQVIEKLANGETNFGEIWSLQRAREAQLASRDVWKKYPREMLMARATTSFVKEYYPNLIMDCPIMEEVRDYSDTNGITIGTESTSVENSDNTEPKGLDAINI